MGIPHRTERRTKHQLPDDAATPEVHSPEVSAEHHETLAIVMKAVSELPSDFRAALLLRVYEGMSFRAIAKALNTTEETARWRVFKARQKLMKLLSPQEIGEETAEDTGG
jgi:RNA polymerase sigma-70 factor (ECF subfamily)